MKTIGELLKELDVDLNEKVTGITFFSYVEYDDKCGVAMGTTEIRFEGLKIMKNKIESLMNECEYDWKNLN